MKNLDFEWLTDEFMLYRRSTRLCKKTTESYEAALHRLVYQCADKLQIFTVYKK